MRGNNPIEEESGICDRVIGRRGRVSGGRQSAVFTRGTALHRLFNHFMFLAGLKYIQYVPDMRSTTLKIDLTSDDLVWKFYMSLLAKIKKIG